jgi:hypothetical protein
MQSRPAGATAQSTRFLSTRKRRLPATGPRPPYQDDDHQFIVYAGPWAEARACWAIKGKDKRGPNARTFTDDVRALLRKNDSDWLEYQRALGREVSKADALEAKMAYLIGGDPPDGECEPDDEWYELLDGMWYDINTLATNLMTDVAVIPVVGQEQIERAVGAVE